MRIADGDARAPSSGFTDLTGQFEADVEMARAQRACIISKSPGPEMAVCRNPLEEHAGPRRGHDPCWMTTHGVLRACAAEPLGDADTVT